MPFLGPNFEKLTISSTLEINEISKKMQDSGRKIFKFGLGQSPFPVPRVLTEELKNCAHIKDYLDVTGLFELRRAVAAFHKKRNRVDYGPENVLIGPGSKELLFQCQMVFDGVTVLPAPSWVSYAPQAKFLNKKLVWLKTNIQQEWHVSPEVLDNYCREESNQNKLLILNSPNNPSGTSHSNLQELARVARKNDLIVLSDEIYAELEYEGSYQSISHYYPEGTIVSGGLSKWCGAGGWRLGTMVFPDQLLDIRNALRATSSETFTSVSAPIQYAAIKGFTCDHSQYLKKSRAILKSVASFVHRELVSVGINSVKPSGGFYLLCDFSEILRNSNTILNDNDLCKKLLADTGVATLPGSDFGLNSEDKILRLAFVDFDGGKILAQLDSKYKLDNDSFEHYFPKIYEGIKKLKHWTLENK